MKRLSNYREYDSVYGVLPGYRIRLKNENPSFLRRQEPLPLTSLDSCESRNDGFPRFHIRLPCGVLNQTHNPAIMVYNLYCSRQCVKTGR